MNNSPHFEKSISQRLRLIASEEDLAALRQIVADAQRGQRPWRPWYMAFVAAIVETLHATHRNGSSDDSGDHATT